MPLYYWNCIVCSRWTIKGSRDHWITGSLRKSLHFQTQTPRELSQSPRQFGTLRWRGMTEYSDTPRLEKVGPISPAGSTGDRPWHGVCSMMIAFLGTRRYVRSTEYKIIIIIETSSGEPSLGHTVLTSWPRHPHTDYVHRPGNKLNCEPPPSTLNHGVYS